MFRKRKTHDRFYYSLTYVSIGFTFLTLLSLVLYALVKGSSLINLDLIKNNYESVTYIGRPSETVLNCDCSYETRDLRVYYSEKWGIGLTDDTDLMGKTVVRVVYLDKASVFNELVDKGISEQPLRLKVDQTIVRIAYYDQGSSLSRYGAKKMIEDLDLVDNFREVEFQVPGGGIRGSIVTTLYLIVWSLVFSLPIGIGAAIYLNEYQKPNRVNKVLRSLIEMLTGVPSIIYGLMGLAVFVPLTIRLTSATGGNLISGALTMSVILLPVIIRTTEESLKVVPDEYRQASIALGATKHQTTFKIILPNAFGGILTATLLSIGRIIGESAALVFAIGATIKDEVSLTTQSASLSVHIWQMMSDEPANVELSAAIALIILLIVLTLNLLIKLIARKFTLKGINNHV